MHVYLDHNIIDDISKGDLSLKPSDKIVWVYSNENLAEIKRSGDTRFLEVLAALEARELKILLNEKFQITGEAQILEYQSPFITYDNYLEAISDTEINQSADLEFFARLAGGDNKEKVLSNPNIFEENIKSLLEPHGLYNDEMKIKVKKIRNDLEEMVNGPLQDIESLEKSRELIGTHKGRAGNLAGKDNPIDELWKIVREGASEMTSDQYFGFDPVDKQGYEEWPMYLGIIGCHAILNFLGFRPDSGLTNTEELPTIMSDGSHIAHAAFCHGLLSRDKKFIAKAKAIYRYKNIGTQVLTTNKANKVDQRGQFTALFGRATRCRSFCHSQTKL